MKAFELAVLAYLVNSLWQVPIVFAGAWIAARLLRPISYALLHRVWVGALFAEIVLPACRLSPRSGLLFLYEKAWTMPTGPGKVSLLSGPVHVVSSGFPAPSQAILVALVFLYLLLCGVLAFRLLYRLIMTINLVQSMWPAELSPDLLEVVDRSRMQASFRLGLTHRLTGPANIGNVILLPPAVLKAVTSHDFEALLTHELAHVLRHDFLKNILYEVLALPLRLHPLVLLTRARLAESREILCDELAAEAAGSRAGYARSLLQLAKHIRPVQPFANLHVIGMLDANTLERRLMNLTTTTPRPARARTFLALTGTIALAVATSSSAFGPAPQSELPADCGVCTRLR